MYRVLFALLAMIVGCDGTEVGTSLSARDTDDGTLYESKWTYESFEVDISLRLRTQVNQEGRTCITTARLDVNDVISASDTYDLAPTDCSILRLTETGDIVLHGLETGHAWSEEVLSVDTSAEVISLGPVTVPAGASDGAIRYRFTLSAPPCPDDDDCSCGALVRHANAERDALSLGRRCD